MDDMYFHRVKLIDYLKEKSLTKFNSFYKGYVEAIKDVIAFDSTEIQPVKRGRWITKSKDYYKAWQDSGRSWDDMPYFVTGLQFACSNCFEQFDVNAEGVEKWNGCPLCLARMDGENR